MTEHEHAKALMEWCEYNYAQFPELKLMFAIPNGGARHIAVASKMKAEGVKAGVPDYFLPVATRTYHGLFIELKTEKGKATKLQKEWHFDLECEGYRVEVCNGWFAASDLLKSYMRSAKEKLL